MAHINLVDIDFNSFSRDEKRIAFIILDKMLQRDHMHNKMVTSFNPKDIYYDTDTKLFNFSKLEDIKPYSGDSKENIVLNNIIDLANLAFCSYLRTYDPKDGLLNMDVVSNEFNKFVDIFDPDDVVYYKKVLVDGYKNRELPSCIYYSTYIQGLEDSKRSNGMNNSKAYVKATEIGRLMSDKNDEAAFSSQFALIVSITATLMFVLGYIVYLLSIF